ncbi:hypothetical protein [Rhizobium yanglingense]
MHIQDRHKHADAHGEETDPNDGLAAIGKMRTQAGSAWDNPASAAFSALTQLVTMTALAMENRRASSGKTEWECRDLAHHDNIVRIAQEAIRAVGNNRPAQRNNDARKTKRSDDSAISVQAGPNLGLAQYVRRAAPEFEAVFPIR